MKGRAPVDERATTYCGDAVAGTALFEGIVASAMDAIVAVDRHFNILAFNAAAEAMFGVEAGQVMGQSLERFIPERFRGDHRRHVDRFAGTGETHRRMGALGTVTAMRADGEEFPVEASIAQMLVEGERVSTVILRETGGQDHQAETMFLAREVDHRAKNILAIMSSLIALTAAPTQADYANALAGRVAALSRANALLSSERWKGAALADLVRGELRAHVESDAFTLNGPDLMLAAPAVQPIGMLLHELVSNAQRHGALSRPRGRVAVRWAEEKDGSLSFDWRELGGPTVKAPARLGLGLVLSRQIIEEQLGGRLQLSWQPEGLALETRFPANIVDYYRSDRDKPAIDSSAPSTGTAGAPGAVAEGKPGTLLIVEDEPILAMQLSRALASFGWTVIGVAGSVETAGEMLATLQRPDAAILDVDLGGNPVFPFARALRHAGVPFMFCTAFEDMAHNREFADCIVVQKPATVLQIVAALRKTVEQARPAG